MANCTSLARDELKCEDVSLSPAKKQRCEDTPPPPPPPPPPPSLSEKTDPRSIIKVYDYGTDDEIDYEDVDICGMHEMTDKEFNEYSRQIKESEGFDVMHFPDSFACGKIMPIFDLDECADRLKACSELALKEYNEKENTKLGFVKVVKANHGGCAGTKYYITFDVKDVDGRTLTFQALVWDGISKTEVMLCRPKISN